MKILKAKFKNFGSYDDELQEITFSAIPTMTQITGVSGNGKSTIAKVLQYALYGKVEGKKMQDLVNWITKKGLYVWINFISNTGKDVVVERGMFPNMFNLWVDGVLYDKSGKPQLQQYIEQELLEIPFYVFNNVISLSVNDFKSFLTMSKADKRAIIDRILGLLILNEMSKSVKDKHKHAKQQEIITNSACGVHERNIVKTEAELERTKADILDKIKERSEELTALKQKLEVDKVLHRKTVEDFVTGAKQTKLDAKIAKEKWHDLGQTGKKIKEKIELFKQERCPTCATNFKTDYYEELMSSLNGPLDKIRLEVQAQGKLVEKLKCIEQLNDDTKNQFIKTGHNIDSAISSVSYELKSLVNTKTPSTESIERILDDLHHSLEKDQQLTAAFSEEADFYKSLEDIVGDSGIKQQAIRAILPALNAEIAILLQEMHIDYQLEFDENFDSHLSFLGEKLGVGSLSTGELKRVDIVVLVAIVRLMKMKYPNINLLFLDEIFSSLDPESIHSVLKVLIQLHKELDINIFVITHLPIPHEIFNVLYEVKKVNQFSKFVKIEN